MYRLIIFLVIGATIAPPPPPPPHMAPPVSEPPPPPPSLKRTDVQTSSTSQIIRQMNEINPDGSYQWSYENDNGISAEEKGQLATSLDGALVAAGSYQYRSSDGSPISVSYIADENGFQPVGSHLPVAPPIPPLIARALEWIAAHPQPDS